MAAAALPAVSERSERRHLAIPWRPLLFGAAVAVAIPLLATCVAYFVYAGQVGASGL